MLALGMWSVYIHALVAWLSDGWNCTTCTWNVYVCFRAAINHAAFRECPDLLFLQASFCLEDVECDLDSSRIFHCAYGTQGISKNCADVYRYDIDCQWVDVTDMPSGRFTLTLAVDPVGLVPETDETNNVAWTKFDYNSVTGSVTALEYGLSKSAVSWCVEMSKFTGSLPVLSFIF